MIEKNVENRVIKNFILIFQFHRTKRFNRISCYLFCFIAIKCFLSLSSLSLSEFSLSSRPHILLIYDTPYMLNKQKKSMPYLWVFFLYFLHLFNLFHDLDSFSSPVHCHLHNGVYLLKVLNVT